MNARLVARAADLGYGSFAVLTDVDVAVAPGKFVAVIGQNGCGKSTLLRSLAGLHRPTHGEVEWDARPLYGHIALSPSSRAQQIAVVLTESPQTGYLTVRDVVGLGRIPYHPFAIRTNALDEEAVTRACRETGIDSITDRVVETLSDGQRQRVMVARALAQEPRVLLLDEPGSFLDPPHQVDLFAQFRRLVADRPDIAVVVATHSIDLAMEYASEIWLIVDGKVRTGAPEVINDPELISAAFPHAAVYYDPRTCRFRPV